MGPAQDSVTPALRLRNRTCFMNQALLDKIESEQYRKDTADFAVGDTVRVHTKVVEGDSPEHDCRGQAGFADVNRSWFNLGHDR